MRSSDTRMPARTRPTHHLALWCLGALVVGCSASGGEASSSPSPSASVLSRSFDALPRPGGSHAAAGGVPDEMLSAVVAQAASVADVEPSAVEVMAAEAVTWSDGSLGCPQPGMSYTQALVPGYRVVVQAGGEELHFHAGTSGEFRHCDDPRPPAEGNANQ